MTVPTSDRVDVDLFCVGTLFFDLVLAGLDRLPEPGEESWARERTVSPGGAANRAVAAARLGLTTGLAVSTGDDVFGTHLWDLLALEPNLDLRWSRRSPEVPTAVTVSVTEGTDRRFLTHGVPGLVPDEALVPSGLPRARAAHLPIDREVPAWARVLRAEGSLLVGGVGWDDTQRWSTDTLANLAYVDGLVLNGQEARAYTRADDPAEALKRLAEHVPLVAVTLGPGGAIAIDGTTGEHADASALDVTAVDPTGAGDVFVAALLCGTLAEWPLRNRLVFANTCAGLSVQRLGGAISAPHWNEVQQTLHPSKKV